eukprot:NODE_5853_length_1728_cov_10.536540.p1 GENE.NODE_5853_length_1728_cov_10.536540~~NODE_5853_length_1728_cov_10.536540.p1  ORF type:complete len:369 (-),score=108.56 NODE_5853_length_1728_cov_10.536540:510-1616(-)
METPDPAATGLITGTAQKRELSVNTTNEPDEEGEDVDLPEDVYGAAMFSCIFDFFEILTGGANPDLNIKLNIFRLTFINLILFVNYMLQASLLYWIYNYVVAPSVHLAEDVYRKYHREVFDRSGEFQSQVWEQWDEYDKASICGIAFASYLFMFAILWLWVVTMVNENRKTERLLSEIIAVEATADPKQMIDDKEQDGMVRVKRLTTFVRWFIYIVIIVPKFIVGFLLLVVGATWLTSTDDFSSLILNAIALEFVVGIDNLLYEALLPKSVLSDIQGTKLWIRAKPKTKKEKEAQVIWFFTKSTMWLVFSLSIVYFFLGYGQYIPFAGVYPGFAHDVHCPSYQEKIGKRLCEGHTDCFPFGQPEGHGD